MIEALLYLIITGETHQYSSDIITGATKKIANYALPKQKKESKKPLLLKDEAVALAAVDLESQKILLSQNFYRPQAIASLTKIMTTLVILEEHSLNEVVTVSPSATRAPGAQIDLLAYERITVQTLIEAMLIPSANDAAEALAIFDAKSEEKFVKKMNHYAQKWGLTSAKFYNASGLDTTNEFNEVVGNTMSAYDVLKLTRRALRNKFIQKTVQKTHFFGTSTDGNFKHSKPNTNQLLGTFLNLEGVKTGYTKLAGECLVTLGTNPNGQKVLTVILGSKNRFGETEKFLSWVYDSFSWK